VSDYFVLTRFFYIQFFSIFVRVKAKEYAITKKEVSFNQEKYYGSKSN